MRTLIKAALAAGLVAGGGLLLTSCGEGGTGVSVAYNASWGDPYWGWYGDYYYPGVGVYVYDRQRHRHAWNDDQRVYWSGRTTNWHGDRTRMRGNWHDFHRR